MTSGMLDHDLAQYRALARELTGRSRSAMRRGDGDRGLRLERMADRITRAVGIVERSGDYSADDLARAVAFLSGVAVES